ncbi:LamB/YcsF family protein [Bifidobacterium gallicum]|nr:5-oxoprolinase subunit PxpA [Bifidobacterium gallicum]KFI59033.1 LamB/YcsF family protein [Bifidobacterium gallicum DSM 20093 = LMG 11596]
MSTIDLNSDMGESFGRWTLGDDAALLDVVSSANIACGFHAGDPVHMLNTLSHAQAHDVTVGAHVAYRDLAGFGRRYVGATVDELHADVMYQLAALRGMAASCGTQVRYVKPHGALYNRIVSDEQHALAVVEAIARIDPSLAILTLPGSAVGRIAREHGIAVFHEAFADRAYTPQGTLVSRREPGAVLHDPDLVAERVLGMVQTGTVQAIDGSIVHLQPDSVCVHGDSAGAVSMAQAIRTKLDEAGITICSFMEQSR